MMMRQWMVTVCILMSEVKGKTWDNDVIPDLCPTK